MKGSLNDGSTVIAGGTVISSATGWIPQAQDIWIEDGRISDIRPSGAGTRDADNLLDAGGLFVLPGLIDLHCHLTFRRTVGPIWKLLSEGDVFNTIRAVRNTLTVLRQGVTTIRELAAPNDINTEIAKAVRSGLLPGPRILSAGTPLGVTGGHASTIAPGLNGAEEFRRAARRVIASGASWIKIIGSNDPTEPHESGGEWSHGEVDEDEIRAVVTTAHKWGARVAAHAMGSEQLAVVVRSGVDTVEHGVYLTEEIGAEMRKRGVALVPTLSGYLETVWPVWDRGADWIRRHTMLIEPHREAFALAIDSQITIGVGTDSAGEIVHELQLMNAYGLGVEHCLSAATKGNASILGLENSIGDVRRGMAADLLIVRRNPLEDFGALREVEWVVQRGRPLKPGRIQLPSGDESGVSEPWLTMDLDPETSSG